VIPREEEICRAAEVLNAGERVAILIGQGIRGAADEVVKVAEVLGAGVAKRCSARTSCPTICRSRQAPSDCWHKAKLRPLNPQRMFWQLPKLPPDAIVTADSGSASNWYARDLKFRKGMRGSLSGTQATMGPGMPYTIAAKFANPRRPVIACVGDGAMQINGMTELLTVAKYWRQWDHPRFVCLVLHNNDPNQVTWEMRAMEVIPKFEEPQGAARHQLRQVCQAGRPAGHHCGEATDVAAAWDEALASDVPVVLTRSSTRRCPRCRHTWSSMTSRRWSTR
jgi:thiamine pyrophosphate-dependent acetolactate synthase large subunit-like protein